MVNEPNWRLPEVPAFELTSPDFRDGGILPIWARAADAGGEDRSPTLHWSRAPRETRSYALTAYDPDAPTGSGFWHWAVYDLPAEVESLPAGAGDPQNGRLPAGAVTLPNEYRQPRFAGAAPPAGHGEHRYVFTVSALDVPHLDVPHDATPAVLGFLMREHVIARAQLTGVQETPS